MNYQHQGPRYPRGRRRRHRNNYDGGGRSGQREHWHHNPNQYRPRFNSPLHSNWSGPQNYHGFIQNPSRPPLLPPPTFQERSFRSPPPLPPARTSPLPGSEEYIQRNIKETSERIKKELNLENKDEEEDNEFEMSKVEISFNSTFKPDAIFSEVPIQTEDITDSFNLSSSEHEVPKVINRRDSKSDTKYSVEEIRNKIIAHITNLSSGKKINLINVGSESYDAAIHQIQKNERLAIIRALRDACNDDQTAEANNILTSIIPDIDIKIENLPADKLEELSSSLQNCGDEIFSTYESTVDPDLMFQQAQEMLSGLPDDIDSVLENVNVQQDNTTLCNMELSPLNTDLLPKSPIDEIVNNLNPLIEPLEDPAAETLKMRELLNEPVISSDMHFCKKPIQTDQQKTLPETDDKQRALEASYKHFEAQIFSSRNTYKEPIYSPKESERFLNDSGRFKLKTNNENFTATDETLLPIDFNFSNSYLTLKNTAISKSEVIKERDKRVLKTNEEETNRKYSPQKTEEEKHDTLEEKHKMSLDERIAKELQKDTPPKRSEQCKITTESPRIKTKTIVLEDYTSYLPFSSPETTKKSHDFLQPKTLQKVTETSETHRKKIWRSPGEKKFMAEQKQVSLYENSDTELDFSGTDTEDENRNPLKNLEVKEKEELKKANDIASSNQSNLEKQTTVCEIQKTFQVSQSETEEKKNFTSQKYLGIAKHSENSELDKIRKMENKKSHQRNKHQSKKSTEEDVSNSKYFLQNEFNAELNTVKIKNQKHTASNSSTSKSEHLQEDVTNSISNQTQRDETKLEANGKAKSKNDESILEIKNTKKDTEKSANINVEDSSTKAPSCTLKLDSIRNSEVKPEKCLQSTKDTTNIRQKNLDSSEVRHNKTDFKSETTDSKADIIPKNKKIDRKLNEHWERKRTKKSRFSKFKKTTQPSTTDSKKKKLNKEVTHVKSRYKTSEDSKKTNKSLNISVEVTKQNKSSEDNVKLNDYKTNTPTSELNTKDVEITSETLKQNEKTESVSIKQEKSRRSRSPSKSDNRCLETENVEAMPIKAEEASIVNKEKTRKLYSEENLDIPDTKKNTECEVKVLQNIRLTGNDSFSKLDTKDKEKYTVENSKVADNETQAEVIKINNKVKTEKDKSATQSFLKEAAESSITKTEETLVAETEGNEILKIENQNLNKEKIQLETSADKEKVKPSQQTGKIMRCGSKKLNDKHEETEAEKTVLNKKEIQSTETALSGNDITQEKDLKGKQKEKFTFDKPSQQTDNLKRGNSKKRKNSFVQLNTKNQENINEEAISGSDSSSVVEDVSVKKRQSSRNRKLSKPQNETEVEKEEIEIAEVNKKRKSIKTRVSNRDSIETKDVDKLVTKEEKPFVIADNTLTPRTRSKRALKQETNDNASTSKNPSLNESAIKQSNIKKEKPKVKSKKAKKTKRRNLKQTELDESTTSVVKIEANIEEENFTVKLENDAEENTNYQIENSSPQRLLRVKCLSQLLPNPLHEQPENLVTDSVKPLEEDTTTTMQETVSKQKQNLRKRKLSTSQEQQFNKKQKILTKDTFSQTHRPLNSNYNDVASQTSIPCSNCELYRQEKEHQKKWIDELRKFDETIQNLLLAKAELYDKLLNNSDQPTRRVARKRTKPVDESKIKQPRTVKTKKPLVENSLWQAPPRNVNFDSKFYQPCYVHLYRLNEGQCKKIKQDKKYVLNGDCCESANVYKTETDSISNLRIVSVTSLATETESVKNVEHLGKTSEIEKLCSLTEEELTKVLSNTLTTNIVLVLKVFGSELLAATDTGKIYCFNLKSPVPPHIISSSNNAAITSLQIFSSKEGEILCVGSLDATLKFYTYPDKKLKKHVQLEEKVQCMELMWGYIFMGSDRGHITRYNSEKNKREYHEKISESNVLVIKATNEGARKVLLVALKQSPVCVRDAMSGLLMRRMEASFSPSVYTILLEKNLVYCGTSKHDILVHNFYDGQIVCKYAPQFTSSTGVVVLHMLGNLLFAGCYNGNIYVFNTAANNYLGCIAGPGGLLLTMTIVDDMIVVGTKQKLTVLLKIPEEFLKEK